jgi:hypothetical protein
MKFMNALAVCQSFTLTPFDAMDVGVRWSTAVIIVRIVSLIVFNISKRHIGKKANLSSLDGKLQYDGKVYLYSSGMPEDLIKRSRLKLVEIGVLDEDILVITVPEGVPEGSIMVTIWPHYLSVAKVRKVREGSIYAPQLFNIDLL